MRIEIAVVNHESQLWFELNGLKFDTLNAIWELDFKELEIVRAGHTVARARVHEARGEPIFDDNGLVGEIRLRGSSLHAEDFALNDHLVLDVPDGFDLVGDLRRSCSFLEATIATLPVGETVPLEALRNRITPELDRTRQAADKAHILRFRRGK